jgi:predicted secreted protein
MESETIAGVWQVRVEKQVVSHDKVAVLGLAKEFEADAQAAYRQAHNAGDSTEKVIFKFLNDAIDTVKRRGGSGIDRPAVLKVLSRNGLAITERQ